MAKKNMLIRMLSPNFNPLILITEQEGLTNPKGRHSNGLKICSIKNSDFMKSPKYRILTLSCIFLPKMLAYIKQYTFYTILPTQV